MKVNSFTTLCSTRLQRDIYRPCNSLYLGSRLVKIAIRDSLSTLVDQPDYSGPANSLVGDKYTTL